MFLQFLSSEAQLCPCDRWGRRYDDIGVKIYAGRKRVRLDRAELLIVFECSGSEAIRVGLPLPSCSHPAERPRASLSPVMWSSVPTQQVQAYPTSICL